MVTCSPELTKIWKVVHNLIGIIVTIPGNIEDEHKEEKVHPLVCVNNHGTLAVTYRGKLHFHVYNLIAKGDEGNVAGQKKAEADSFVKKESINLRREIIANGVNDFNFTPVRDQVSKIKLIGGDEATHLRIYMQVDGREFVSDVQLSDSVAHLRQEDKY